MQEHEDDISNLFSSRENDQTGDDEILSKNDLSFLYEAASSQAAEQQRSQLLKGIFPKESAINQSETQQITPSSLSFVHQTPFDLGPSNVIQKGSVFYNDPQKSARILHKASISPILIDP